MIDMEKVGKLIQDLRKEKKMTQKQLADNLGVSDKAVSKWERGISIPDINLLEPLADQLGITLSELLHGEQIQDHITVEEAEVLLKDSLNFVISNKTIEESKKKRYKYFFSTVIFTVINSALLFCDYDPSKISIGIIVLMNFLFQIYFTFFTKESLPKYYDENKISYYTDGLIRIHMAGIYFNNKNWLPILHGLCFGMTGCSALILIITVITILFPINIVIYNISSCVILFVCLFVPLIVQAKRY